MAVGKKCCKYSISIRSAGVPIVIKYCHQRDIREGTHWFMCSGHSPSQREGRAGNQAGTEVKAVENAAYWLSPYISYMVQDLSRFLIWSRTSCLGMIVPVVG